MEGCWRENSFRRSWDLKDVAEQMPGHLCPAANFSFNFRAKPFVSARPQRAHLESQGEFVRGGQRARQRRNVALEEPSGNAVSQGTGAPRPAQQRPGRARDRLIVSADQPPRGEAGEGASCRIAGNPTSALSAATVPRAWLSTVSRSRAHDRVSTNGLIPQKRPGEPEGIPRSPLTFLPSCQPPVRWPRLPGLRAVPTLSPGP